MGGCPDVEEQGRSDAVEGGARRTPAPDEATPVDEATAADEATLADE